MKVNNKQKRHKRHDETMSAVVYSIVSDIYTHLHIRVYVHMYVCILVSTFMHAQLVSFIFFCVFFLVLLFFDCLYKNVRCLFIQNCMHIIQSIYLILYMCLSPFPLLHRLSVFPLLPPYLPCGFLLFRQPGKQRNQMNNCKFCCAR